MVEPDLQKVLSGVPLSPRVGLTDEFLEVTMVRPFFIVENTVLRRGTNRGGTCYIEMGFGLRKEFLCLK